MRHYSLTQPIDPVSCAESVIALLEHLNFVQLPPEERMALVSVQIEAIEDLLATFPVPFAGDAGSFRFEAAGLVEPAAAQDPAPRTEPGDGKRTRSLGRRASSGICHAETSGSGI